eukprot:TRINITY_DN583_c0_g1_i1.p1 TRINITY_DN583_c0_g1~~TRINITY_DN583_c0_g1_i1.p1  ORF type:complete len:212 (-),score=28.60 TRINITY_DN583_c0_g1_i1:84-674(-)
MDANGANNGGTAKKVLIIGSRVGKTSVFGTFANKKFDPEVRRTSTRNVPKDHEVPLTYNDKPVTLQLFEYAEPLSRAPPRHRYWKPTDRIPDVFILAFSITQPESVTYLKNYILPKIQQDCPDVRKLLIGTKVDLREDKDSIERLAKSGEEPISFEQGMKIANALGCDGYRECSALTGQGLDGVFTAVTQLAFGSN